jgi:hypothetical protein
MCGGRGTREKVVVNEASVHHVISARMITVLDSFIALNTSGESSCTYGAYMPELR